MKEQVLPTVTDLSNYPYPCLVRYATGPVTSIVDQYYGHKSCCGLNNSKANGAAYETVKISSNRECKRELSSAL